MGGPAVEGLAAKYGFGTRAVVGRPRRQRALSPHPAIARPGRRPRSLDAEAKAHSFSTRCAIETRRATAHEDDPAAREGTPDSGFDEDHPYATALVARQPIFDARRRVRGYELLFRDSMESVCARFADQCQATMRVIADAYVCLGPGMSGDAKIMVNFSRSGIMDHLPYAMPPGRTVIDFGECSRPDGEVIAALRKLKSDGYLLSLDGFRAVGECGPLLPLADIVKVDVLDQTREDVAAAVEALGGKGAVLLAKKVETADLFEMCKAMGFTRFQGFFFQRPELVAGRKLSSNQQSRLKLFRLIEREDMDIEKVAEIIQADVSISFRLLALLNSAAFGLPQKVDSIERAIMMLGWKSLRNWLRVIIFTDPTLRGKPGNSRHLGSARSIHGNRSRSPPCPVSSSTLFLLGLFSLLDAMLDLPMREIVTSLPVEEELKEALCGEHNTHAAWLELTKCFESADWRRLDAIVDDLGLDPALVAKCYHEALAWTNSFFLLNI